jgi:hypothetical protein
MLTIAMLLVVQGKGKAGPDAAAGQGAAQEGRRQASEEVSAALLRRCTD